MPDQAFSRRDFLRRAAVVTAGAGTGVLLASSAATAAGAADVGPARKARAVRKTADTAVPADAAPPSGDTVATFALDPVGGGSSCRGGTGNGTCGACGACRKHAENKVFRTKEAADEFRAHKGCRCAVVDGAVIDKNVADAVFAKGDVADKRDPETGGLLHPGGGVTVPVMAATLPVIAAAGGGLAWYLMRRHDRAATEAAGDGTGAPVDHGDWR